MACHRLERPQGNLWPFACGKTDSVADTIVYIDGFNLYYRVLKGSHHKWLDLEALCRALLPPPANIIRINFYTARVSSKVDAMAPFKQQIYLSALATLPLVHVHLSEFMVKEKWAKLAQPPAFKPACTLAPSDMPVVAKIIKTEEKGSDVKLGAHLVRDAFTGAFHEAAVLTNDTDIEEPIRIVTQETGKRVTLLSPVRRPAASLVQYASAIRYIGNRASAAQFPDTIIAAAGHPIAKPQDWFPKPGM